MAITPPGRDRAVDVARLAALVVVMFGHCALLLAAINDGGMGSATCSARCPRSRRHLGRPGHAAVLPRGRRRGGLRIARGHTVGNWLFTRAQRLCRPVFWYLAAWSLGLLVVRMTLGAESAARPRTRVRRAAVVPRGLPRGAGARTGVDTVAQRCVPPPSCSPCLLATAAASRRDSIRGRYARGRARPTS